MNVSSFSGAYIHECKPMNEGTYIHECEPCIHECKFTNKFIVNVAHELMFVNVSSFCMNVRPYVHECKPML